MFYNQVAKLCFENNIKITALARKLNLSPSAPARWKDGSFPKTETLQKIADYFDVSVDYLLNGDDHPAGNTIGGSVQNSAVVQGSVGSTVSVNNGGQLQGNEAELIEIFRGLDRKGQIAVLNFAYEQAEKQD